MANDAIHYRYWIGILAGVCVAIASTIWMRSAELVTLIAFAGTLSSLILAVLAILISLQSNSSSQRTLHSLADAAGKIDTSAGDIRAAGDQLALLVSEVPAELSKMSDKLEKAQESWGKGREGVRAVLQENSEPAESTTSPQAESVADLIANSPPGGVLALYMVVRAHEEGKKFNPSQFMPDNLAGFARGYIRGIGAAGIVGIKYRIGKFEVADLKSLDASSVKEVVERLKSRNAYIRTNVPKIEAFFGDPDEPLSS